MDARPPNSAGVVRLRPGGWRGTAAARRTPAVGAADPRGALRAAARVAAADRVPDRGQPGPQPRELHRAAVVPEIHRVDPESESIPRRSKGSLVKLLGQLANFGSTLYFVPLRSCATWRPGTQLSKGRGSRPQLHCKAYGR